MRFSHQQLTIWYATADTPAPVDDSIEARHAVSVTVAVQPPSPSNTVVVRFQIDDGQVQTLRAVRVRTDFAQGVEYFRAVFPDFWIGERVSYLPIVSCSGRSAPGPEVATQLPSSFRLVPEPLSVAQVRGDSGHDGHSAASTPKPDLHPFSLEYLASLRIPLQKPEIIGETPDGIRVNWFWYPAEGAIWGPKLNGKVLPLGGDWMTIRRDGIGVMDVRATVQTDDGVLLYVTYQGYFDLGEHGYQNFLDDRSPAKAPARTSPRFYASDPKYLWLNRVTCLGIGEVNMKELAYEYDLYVVR